MKNISIFMMVAALAFSLSSCNYCKLFGDNKLGDNFSLLEGDKTEDNIIVYCIGNKNGCCVGGIPVIPSEEDSLTKYVLAAKSNNLWIIVKTMSKNNSEKFWIINKNFSKKFEYDDGGKFYSLIQSNVLGPMNLSKFELKIDSLKINLHF